MEKLITDTLGLIREQIGLDLSLCSHFNGVRTRMGRHYFNVILPTRCSRSTEYRQLESFAHSKGLIEVQQNGVNRVAIFPVSKK